MNARNTNVRLASIAAIASMTASAAAQCPPSPPAEVQAEGSSCQMVIRWAAVSGADAYGVYRGATWEDSTWLGNASGTEFVDISPPGGSSSYWVVARRLLCVPGWHQSAPAGPAIGYNVSSPPPTPINVVASDGGFCGGVEIRWGVPPNTYIPAEYAVLRSTVPLYATSTEIGTASTGLGYYDMTAQPGTTYYYWVYARNDCGGAGSTWDSGYVSTTAAPPNNACASATVVQSGQTYSGSTGCATSDGSASCGSSSRDVWYRFQPASNGVLHVDTCSGSDLFNTVLSVHSGCPGNAVNQIACSDNNACGLRSSLDVLVTGGQPYRIRVAGKSAADVGTFKLAVSFTTCYANCDGSTVAPVLSANDFQCFLNHFAAGDPYANCDGSVRAPTLNIMDLQCFINRYAGGCS